MDKDCELQKIAVFDDYLVANVNAQYTFLAGGLIGILVLVLTLFYEGFFDVFGGRYWGLIPFAIVLVGYSMHSGVYCSLSRTNKPNTSHWSLT